MPVSQYFTVVATAEGSSADSACLFSAYVYRWDEARVCVICDTFISMVFHHGI